MSVIEIRPSRLRAILVLALHVAAAVSFLFAAEPWVMGWGAGLVLASALHAGWRMRGVRALALRLEDDGALVFDPASPDERRARVLAGTTVLPFAIWLQWSADDRRSAGASLLLPDAVRHDDWRQLQVWLRLKARPGMAGTAV